MLTIKHIEPTKHETIIQTPYVGAEPSHRTSDNIGKVWFERPDGNREAIDKGTVYVMNDLGKTVATYYLGGWGAVSTEPQEAA